MEINYHYFAVKVLAVKAGFGEIEAQTIAFYSQAISDYSIREPITLDEVPSYASYLAKKELDKWSFTPVTTGVSSWFNYDELTCQLNQRSIMIPFHFIPVRALSTPVSSRAEYRVVPAKLSTPSLIQEMLLEARNAYINEPILKNLIRIGTLLHIFADTYAHQNFSGFWGWENNAELTDAVNVDVRPENSQKKSIQSPPVGNAKLKRISDDSSQLFSWKQQQSSKDSFSLCYHRNNTTEFCKASLEILNYLLSCHNQDPITNLEWDKFIVPFKDGLRTNEQDINKLNSHWQTFFPNIAFHYNKDILFKITDDFFQFNVFADEIRRKVNGITHKNIDFNNYIMQVSDGNVRLNRLAAFQTNN